MEGLVTHLITSMNGLPPELVWVALLGTCLFTILVLHRLFGAAGLIAYIVLAIIGANIQVLKVVQFSIYSEPVALGTILFATSYLATDILSERYGYSLSSKAVWIGFFSYFSFSLIMIVSLGFAPLTEAQAGEEMSWAMPYQSHIQALFAPQPTFFVAGMAAFLLSQLHDVFLFHKLKERFKGKHLWFRNNLSTMISSLIDNIIFSVLAWIILASNPLPWETVLLTYILGTYWLRLLVAVLDTPVIYLACKWTGKKQDAYTPLATQQI